MLRSKSLLVAGLLLLGGSVAGAGEEQDLVIVQTPPDDVA